MTTDSLDRAYPPEIKWRVEYLQWTHHGGPIKKTHDSWLMYSFHKYVLEA